MILSDQWKNDSTNSQIEALKKAFENVASNNLNYLETRVNKVSESSDNYQVASTTRINILEARVEGLEKENKVLKLQQRNIITQTNTQIVNGERYNKNNK
ncbi:hypothetical protein D3C86_1978120 [compost metagenome]